jgi:hypothetical protein
MNVLKRSKLVAQGLAEGKTLPEMSKMYGKSKTALSARASDYLRLINKPWYDAVAAMDLPDLVGGKFVYALEKYEAYHGVDLTLDYIADSMDNYTFASQKGVGVALSAALSELQRRIRLERVIKEQ